MTNRKLLAILSAVAVTAVALPAFADAGPDAAAIYKSKCAMCHAADGSGNTPTGKAMKVRDLRSAEVQKMTNEEMTKVIADGKGKMPAFKSKLDQASIDALIAFIRTLKK
jgi:cytochrome c6